MLRSAKNTQENKYRFYRSKNTIMTDITAVILAAGKGTRMESDQPKVLHEVAGKAMIRHVLDTCKAAGIKDIVLVAGDNHRRLKDFTSPVYNHIKYVIQKPQLGTAHAILKVFQSKKPLKSGILIINGDVPSVEPGTLRNLINRFTKKRLNGIICSAKIKNPFGYGRIIKNTQGYISRIVEEKDAGPSEKAIKEINGGIYVFKKQDLKDYIVKIRKNEAKQEYYLTDIAGLMSADNKKIESFNIIPEEIQGINDRIQLMEISKVKRRKILEKLARSGVTIEDFDTAFIDENVKIGKDTVIRPFTVIKGRTIIGKKCSIGPFSHIRPETVIGDSTNIGNYVEVKKSKIGNHVHVAHLSYIGDTEIGDGTNIGAGTITANYDGVKKNKTKIGKNVSVGSDVVFRAPVTIGDNAVIGAGSIITDSVPAGSLAIARARQVTKKDWMKRRNKK